MAWVVPIPLIGGIIRAISNSQRLHVFRLQTHDSLAMNDLLKKLVLALCVMVVSSGNWRGLAGPYQMKQSNEVLDAYRVCNSFQSLMSEDLDFDRAYEATFPKELASRRAIAIAEGGFQLEDYSDVPSDLLVKAYKLQMQIVYLLMPLGGPSDEEEKLFFPPRIKAILERRAPAGPGEFNAFVQRLEQDVTIIRDHLRRLSADHPLVASRIKEFKSVALAASLEPPPGRKVEAAYGYFRSRVLPADAPYYQIGCFTVSSENGEMRIFGINFFTKLF